MNDFGHKYVLELCYNGTAYHGWQIQANAHTVQAAVNSALQTLLKHPIDTLASGRTDTGVHALQQFVQFTTLQSIPNYGKFLFQLNALLPADIYIKHLYEAAPDFSARHQALWRKYEYRISLTKNPFYINSALFLFGKKPNAAAMQQAADTLLQYTDFQSFCKYHTDVETYDCTILEAWWEQRSAHDLVFHIKANRFLRGMVRAIVGTLLQVGRGNMSIDDFKNVIERKDRIYAKSAAPPQGLYLAEVAYPPHLLRLLA